MLKLFHCCKFFLLLLIVMTFYNVNFITKIFAQHSEQLSAPVTTKLDGLYQSKKWGTLALKVDKQNEVNGVYEYKNGRITGSYDPESGRVTGWWCEEHQGKRTLFGHLEFQFEESDANEIQINGKWTNGYSKVHWYNDWNLALHSADIPPKMLTKFSDRSNFCYKKTKESTY